MHRRDFVRRLAATAAGLLVAPDALELLVEPRRQFWMGHSFATPAGVPGQYEAYLASYFNILTPLRLKIDPDVWAKANPPRGEFDRVFREHLAQWDSETPPVWNPA